MTLTPAAIEIIKREVVSGLLAFSGDNTKYIKAESTHSAIAQMTELITAGIVKTLTSQNKEVSPEMIGAVARGLLSNDNDTLAHAYAASAKRPGTTMFDYFAAACLIVANAIR